MRDSPRNAPRIDRPSQILLSPGLLVSLAVLVLNDWVLKPAFHNAVTGKLSDVAGVAALGLFARALAPRRPVAAAVCAGTLFALWKSPASQPLIDGWNALGSITIHRVVDGTDLAALLVLPWVWSYAPRRVTLPEPLRRALSAALAAACVVAFAATTIPVDPLVLENEYPLELSADSVRFRIYDLRLEILPPGIPPRPLGARDADTVRLGIYSDSTRLYADIEVRAEVRRGPPGQSVLRLLKASDQRNTPEQAEVTGWAETVLLPALHQGAPALPPVQWVRVGPYQPRLLGPFALYEPRAEVSISLQAPAHVAIIEATAEGVWNVIYPAGPGDEAPLAAGTHVLRTTCAGAPGQLIPAREPVPACGVARRATMADAEAAAGIDPPTCLFPAPRGALATGYLLVIAADAPLGRQALQKELRGRCLVPPVSSDHPEWLDRMIDDLGVGHWEMTQVELRR
jgi:hypothetical protein